MNHSLKIIADFVCTYYGVTMDQLASGDRHWKFLKPMYMIIMLSGKGRDSEIADMLNRSRPTICNDRKTFYGNMRGDQSLRAEYENLKLNLIKYELS